MSWRYELKYLVDTRTQAQLEPLVGSRLVRGEHVGEDGSYPVLSQYFDGPDLPFYLDKVAGVESRVKFRMRTYGWKFDSSALWFLEIKRKENACVSKTRVPIPPGEVDPADPRTWDALDEATLGPFVAARDLLYLQPAAQVWYQRAVYQSPAGDLRVTWDTSSRALYPGESMRRGLLYDPLRAVFPDHLAVLEIKTAQTIPRWLAQIIRQVSLTPQAVSKYVLAMNALDLSRRMLATC